jgi:hypothetical protein
VSGSGISRRVIADGEASWARAFARGHITDPAIPPGTGERVALRIPDAVVAILRPGPSPRPVVEKVLSRGPVVVTDRRVLSLGGPPFEAAWDPQVRAVVPDRDGCGALIFPTDDAFRAGRRLAALLPPFMLNPELPPRAATLPGYLMWNRVAAAWRASAGELDIWVRKTKEELRSAEKRAQFLRTATDDVLRLRHQLASGGRRGLGFAHPRYEPGERFALAIPQIQRRRVERTADAPTVGVRAFADDRGKLRGEGALYVTDRRAVLMGGFGKQIAEWRWADLDDVKTIYPFAGVRFIASRDDEVDDAAMHIYHVAVAFNMPMTKVARLLVQTEAAFVIGSGRDLDAWLAELADRVL